METLIFPFCGVTSFFFKQSRTEESTPALKKTRALPNEKLSVSKKVIHSVLSGKVRQQAFGNTR